MQKLPERRCPYALCIGDNTLHIVDADLDTIFKKSVETNVLILRDQVAFDLLVHIKL